MNKANVFVVGLIICSWSVTADIYIKENTHTDSYYYGGVVRPAEDTTVEIWFHGNKLAHITAGRKVIVDGNKNRVFIINLRDRTHVEASMPLDMKKILPPEIVPILQSRMISGTLQETGEKKKIKEWDCTCYATTVNQPTALEIKNWSTPDVPFNWQNLNKLLSTIRRLGNVSESYIQRLSQIKGFVVHRDIQIFLQGTSFGSTSQVIEISEKTSPDNIYSIPQGFQKKDRLSVQDLRNR